MERTGTNLYHELTETEKQKIQEKAQGLNSLLSIWASQYPIIRARRSVPVSVLVATVLPDFPVPLSLLVGKLILFIFAVDDLADERILSYIEFARASQVWEAIARYGSANDSSIEDGNLQNILGEIRNELSQRPLFLTLCDLWASRLKSLCGAMAKEYEYGVNYKASGKELLPGLDEYIQGGIHSVGFPFWGTSVLILLSEPELLDQLEAVNNTIFLTGAAIRLYNDIRTYEKEVQEDNINAITIALRSLETRQSGLTTHDRFQQAQDTVFRLADDFARKSIESVGKIQTATGKFEKMIQRIVAFHAYLYGSRHHNRDYHTITSSESFSMIQGE